MLLKPSTVSFHIVLRAQNRFFKPFERFSGSDAITSRQRERYRALAPTAEKETNWKRGKS